MSRADHDLIAEIVNRRHPGHARLVIVPKAGPSLDTFESQQAAFNGEDGRFDESVTSQMIE